MEALTHRFTPGRHARHVIFVCHLRARRVRVNVTDIFNRIAVDERHDRAPADEVAVARFLGGRLDFNGIARLLGASVERFGQAGPAAPSLEGLVALDSEVRAFAEAYR